MKVHIEETVNNAINNVLSQVERIVNKYPLSNDSYDVKDINDLRQFTEILNSLTSTKANLYRW